MPLTFALIPLDERPVNTRYPKMLGAIAGAQILLPDSSILGRQRDPADLEAVSAWLQEAAGEASAAIVSCDFLAYGNLINARIGQDSAAGALARLRALEEINTRCPVHAFSLITRVSNADDCVEEPLYWATWGTKFYRYARLTHQAEQGILSQDGTNELAALQKELPKDLVADWLTRRLRNHTVNLGLLDMAARGKLSSLLITSDDTSGYGFPSRERDWLGAWIALIGMPLAERVMMHPGADEVGSVLVARLVNEQAGQKPAIWPLYSIPGDEEIVAPYEDRPVRETVTGQIAACGCRVAPSAAEADIVLGIATPSPRRTDYHPEFLEEDRRQRTEPYGRFLEELGRRQKQGKPVALADVAYPNGADPLLAEMLLAGDSPVAPGTLCAYGAWNTAGNTLGTVVAQASCALRIGADSALKQAQCLFLAHRFLEDWGYQTVVRREARAEAEKLWGRREPAAENPEEQAALCAFIERRLGELLVRLQARGVGEGQAIAAGSTRLPWQRTFEVDFDLLSAG